MRKKLTIVAIVAVVVSVLLAVFVKTSAQASSHHYYAAHGVGEFCTPPVYAGCGNASEPYSSVSQVRHWAVGTSVGQSLSAGLEIIERF